MRVLKGVSATIVLSGFGLKAFAQPILSPEELLKKDGDANVVIIEADTVKNTYDDSHIKGALFFDARNELLDKDLKTNFQKKHFEKLMSALGVKKETELVVLGDYPAVGGWLYWYLSAMGHEKVQVLDGGRQHWMQLGFPKSISETTATRTNYKSNPKQLSQFRVEYDEVLNSIHHPNRILLDVRSPEEFNGEEVPGSIQHPGQRRGHIPGAVNVPFNVTLNDNLTIKSVSELRKIFLKNGITPNKQIFTYCAVGARAGYVWFILKEILGYPNVRNYDGSWAEWGQKPGAPIER